VSSLPFYLGLFGALLTAFYMTRQVCYVFFGENRGVNHAKGSAAATASRSKTSARAGSHSSTHHENAPHESPRVMTLPLVILAVCAVLLGFLGTPAWPWFQSYLEGRPAALAFSLPVQRLGPRDHARFHADRGARIGAAWMLYGARPAAGASAPDPLEQRHPGVFAALRDDFTSTSFMKCPSSV